MTIFLMFFIELMAARFDVFGEQEHDIERAGPSIHPIKKREKYSDSSTQGQSGKQQISLYLGALKTLTLVYLALK
jgi:solute carrier family 39 (zinc transporter), member 1/2/3